MSHPAWVVARALGLRSRGRTATEISDALGIPRRTVSDWIAGRVPRSVEGPRCICCGSVGHRFDELPDVYAYLLGLYLGDGSIAAHRRGVYKLRITLDAAYPHIVAEGAAAMRTVLPSASVNRYARPYGDIEVYAYSKVWPCLFPQHGPGRKHLRSIQLTGWQVDLVDRVPHLLLRGLIQSDGCRFINTGRRWKHARYSFRNRSSDIRRIFCEACDLVGLRWTLSGDVVYISRKEDVGRMDRFVGPKR